MNDRIPCCVPGCRRTARRTDDDDATTQIICGKHWRTIDPVLRARHKRVRERERKLRRKAIQARRAVRGVDRLVELFTLAALRAWDACKTDATIKAVMHAEDTPRQRRRITA